jgi:hypothetical protein
MSSSENGPRRKTKRVALLTAEATREPKSPVPVDPVEDIMTGRVVTPFVIVEHASKDGSSLGILVLEQAVA